MLHSARSAHEKAQFLETSLSAEIKFMHISYRTIENTQLAYVSHGSIEKDTNTVEILSYSCLFFFRCFSFRSFTLHPSNHLYNCLTSALFPIIFL